jgi:hypothetical protein
LLIGIFDLGVDRESGITALLNQLGDMGLTVSRDRLQAEEDVRRIQDDLTRLGVPVSEVRLPEEHNRRVGSFESDDIAAWVAQELGEEWVERSTGPDLGPKDATELIRSFRPGVWEVIPDKAQKDFIEAGRSIDNGQLRGAALLLGTCAEYTFNHFYECLLPAASKAASWSDKETALYQLSDKDIPPAIELMRQVRQDHRNPSIHGAKEYDRYEIQDMWQLFVLAASRLARVLQRRSPPPGSPQCGQ